MAPPLRPRGRTGPFTGSVRDGDAGSLIVYLATYPRSGHALTRTLIRRNFGLLVSNGYPSPPRVEKPEMQLAEAPEPVEGFPGGLAWGPWTLVYRSPTSGQRLRMLKNDALRILTPDLRKRLAAEPNLFLVKTHERAPGPCFPGEMSIRMVRHPGAALASLVRMFQDFTPEKAVSLAEAIRGVNVPGGDWSSYQQSWAEADIPSIRLSYEAAFEDQTQAVRDIGALLGLPTPAVVAGFSIAEAHAANPKRNPGQGIDGWRASTSEEDLELLWRLHGQTAEAFGYARDLDMPA